MTCSDKCYEVNRAILQRVRRYSESIKAKKKLLTQLTKLASIAARRDLRDSGVSRDVTRHRKGRGSKHPRPLTLAEGVLRAKVIGNPL